MHELSIACGILDIVSESVAPGNRVLSVRVAVGPLSGVCSDSLDFCFTEMAASRNLGSPKLDIKKLSARVLCLDCSAQAQTDDLAGGCPSCGSFARQILSGYECQVESVTFEENENP